MQYEERVLSILLRHHENILKTGLSPDDFKSELCNELFVILQSLAASGEKIDLFMVADRMKRQDCLRWLISIRDDYPSAVENLSAYSEAVKSIAKNEKLKGILSTTLNDCNSSPKEVDSFIGRLISTLSSFSRSDTVKVFDGKSMMKETIDYLDEVFDLKSDGKLVGVPSGMKKLDGLLGGFHKSDFVVVGARPGMGKCLGLGTKVVMFDGTLKNVEDVVVGDQLMGDDSTPRNVLSLARGQENMYLVRQNKGIDYRVNESHVLSLRKSREEGHGDKGSVLNISVADYIEKSTKFKTNYKGYKVAVDFPEQELEIDPYFFGLWLGDGSADNSEITNPDEEVYAFLEEYAGKLCMKVHTTKTKNRCAVHRVSNGLCQKGNKSISLTTTLKNLGVLNNKHIPQNFISNSYENRLRLLAGLIDSDGYNNGNCVFEITQKNKTLANQIKYLADTLGFRTTITEKIGAIKSIGFEGVYSKIIISGDIDSIPVLVKRKKSREWKANRDWRNTGISVEFDRFDDYYGFTLDGNSLFLLEDMTVTHNTAWALTCAVNAAKSGYKVGFISTEMSVVQVGMRITSLVSGIPAYKMRDSSFNDQEWPLLTAAARTISSLPLFIYDKPSCKVSDIAIQARAWAMTTGLDIIFVDYLTRLKPESNSENRTLAVGDLATALKTLARNFNIPVVALAQLSREVTKRKNAIPQSSDLRDSGVIEQEADQILMLYRGIVYDETARENDANIIVDKNRHGDVAMLNMEFQKEVMRWCDPGYEEYVD